MLSRAHRLRRSAEFSRVVRRGVRATTPTVVLHALWRTDNEPTRVGFVVGRSVGDAVRRNRVKRQLRHLVHDRLAVLPAHASVVVRTNRAAADADAATLTAALDQCLDTLSRRRAARGSA